MESAEEYALPDMADEIVPTSAADTRPRRTFLRAFVVAAVVIEAVWLVGIGAVVWRVLL